MLYLIAGNFHRMAPNTLKDLKLFKGYSLSFLKRSILERKAQIVNCQGKRNGIYF